MNTEIIVSDPRAWVGVVDSFSLVKVPADKINGGTTYIELVYHDKAVHKILAFGNKSKKLNIFGDDPDTGLPEATITALQELIDAGKPFPIAEINLKSFEVTNLPKFAHKYSRDVTFADGRKAVKGAIVLGDNQLPRWETALRVTCIDDDALGIHETARSVASRILHNKDLVALDNANNTGEAIAEVEASAEGAEVTVEQPAVTVEATKK